MLEKYKDDLKNFFEKQKKLNVQYFNVNELPDVNNYFDENYYNENEQTILNIPFEIQNTYEYIVLNNGEAYNIMKSKKAFKVFEKDLNPKNDNDFYNMYKNYLN
jgi:hypothetical protein